MKKEFPLASKIYSKKTINKTKDKVKLLGINNTLDPIYFLNLRLLTTIIIFFIILYFFPTGYIYAPLISVAYYYLIYYYSIDYQIKKRARKLEFEALYFFEVLTLTIEAGRDLKSAIEITCNNIDSEISDEFKKTIKEVKYSKTLDEALKDMRKRIPSDNINNIILNISQTSIFGGNIIDTMYNQIDFLSDRKMQDIKGQISKLPVKISILSVIFFVPLMLLLILGPVILNLLFTWIRYNYLILFI